MTIENWLSEVEECKGQNATPIPNCLFTETRLSLGARFGVYIQLLRLVARSPYWRSASGADQSLGGSRQRGADDEDIGDPQHVVEEVGRRDPVGRFVARAAAVDSINFHPEGAH